jgi:demethoxyubiquinone hydroxylase (CLK1/Coq7/Cat5 family)
MRWIGVALAIAAAAFAFASLLARDVEPPAPPRETISDASRAELDRVLREAGAGEEAARP